MTNKHIRGDRIISFAVTIQSLLVVLQMVIMDFFHLPDEQATTFRVFMTAIPMIIAIMIALSRKGVRMITGYLITLFLLVITIAIHPDNTSVVISQGSRFLLPVVLPSFLCLTTVYNYYVFEKTMYFVSWATVMFVLLYVLGIFMGIVSISTYNMSLSFACVLPFVAVYSHRQFYDRIACLFLFIFVMAIGARGPLLCMILYVVMDMFQYKSKWRIVVLIVGIALLLFLPQISVFFESIGISSRTLYLLQEGEISADSGRKSLTTFFLKKLYEHPFLGLGLFGDRLSGEIVYCHNLLLEVVLDFGLFFGGALIVLGVVELVIIYLKADTKKRNQLLKYLCALVIPLMTSSSYLIDSSFAIFVGLCYLINKERAKQCQLH